MNLPNESSMNVPNRISYESSFECLMNHPNEYAMKLSNLISFSSTVIFLESDFR